jgi:imidazolonepropionase-like amidohydrolase
LDCLCFFHIKLYLSCQQIFPVIHLHFECDSGIEKGSSALSLRLPCSNDQARKDAYIGLLIEKVMPEVRRRRLAEFFDVFCEKGVFSVGETRRLVNAAKRAGFKLRIHADEFSALGGAAPADHLISITEEGLRFLDGRRV